MDFFEQQAKAHRKTKWLVIYFALAVAAMIAAVYVAAILMFSVLQERRYHEYDQGYPHIAAWNPVVFFGVSIAVLGIVGTGSAYKTMSLSDGGSAVSELMGGRLIKTNTADLHERKLLNVVEEMSIASGVPMPQVYVMDEENGINAFAAGHKPSDATITVTRGCMRILTRDQLQGVIGHEFSHILNGDMRLNIRLMGIIFGILCLAIIGRILLQTSGGRRGNNALPLFGVFLLIIGYIGVFFGRLIQAAVSRQREFLADASSVQFTRNPEGITGALKKIGGLGEMGSRLVHPHTEELSHMFFSNGVSEPFFGLMETHPPLTDRIRVFEPQFDGTFPEVRYDDVAEGPKEPEEVPAQASARGPLPDVFGTIMGGSILAGSGKPPVIRPHTVLPNLGNPTPLHLKYAEQLRDSLPDSLRAAAHEPADAMALVYAMLLADDENLRAQQLAGLEQRAGAGVREKTAVLFPDVAAVATHAHLPMLSLALGALKQLSSDQYETFSKTLGWLISTDGKVEMFEFVLQKIVLRNLDSRFHGAVKPIVEYYSVKPLAPDCSVVLSALAIAGSNDANETQTAFDAGAPYLRAPQDSDLRLLPAAECGVQQLGASLDRLDQAAPIIKKNLIDACVHVVGADGVILETEAELLRAICDTLDCPMPPLVAN
ncbi:MAG TPA: M48 family metallopeptidase [Candidatus Sulfotelmatobacter sp.]|nr:M48 family metallopeptidase [Candidatus Sulfotelmatobacter sp.]